MLSTQSQWPLGFALKEDRLGSQSQGIRDEPDAGDVLGACATDAEIHDSDGVRYMTKNPNRMVDTSGTPSMLPFLQQFGLIKL
jgi:hypothetical protein